MFQASTAGVHRWEVVRVHRGHKTKIVLLSERFFAITTHFHRVTVPCSVEGCALCDLLPARGLFYIACSWDAHLAICELGAASSAHFEQHAKLLHGGMRPGQVFELSRSGQRKPVYAECVGMQDTARAVTQLELAQRVLALYKYPCCNPGESLEDYETRIRRLCSRRNELLAATLRASTRAGV